MNEKTAYLLSIGLGDKSRIYKTIDGGTTWNLQLSMSDPRAFLDAIAFWDAEHGIAMGDPVDGRFTILTSDDGGMHWTTPTPIEMPPALVGEGAFAASGTCLVVEGEKNAWFGTGRAQVARVFRSTDRGRTWTAHMTPIVAANASSGIFSLAFRDSNNGIAVGGDYKQPERAIQVVARTTDGGRTWNQSAGHGPRGFRSGVVYLPDGKGPILAAAGPTGADASIDDGLNWFPLSDKGSHAVDARDSDSAWAVGENGIIARFHITIPSKRDR